MADSRISYDFIQSFTNLTLNTYRNVLFNEILNHGKMIFMCLSHFFDHLVVQIKLLLFLLEFFEIHFVNFNGIDARLDFVEPLIV